MSENKENVPKMRFPGFTDDWEQSQFRDFTNLSQGLQIAIADRFEEPASTRKFYITNEFLSPKNTVKYYIESPSKSVISEETDILMTRTGNTGKVITGVEGAYHNNFFKISYDEKKTDRWFLFYLLNSESIQREILVRAGRSTIPDLNHSDFYKITVAVPRIKEQIKIGAFFRMLDSAILLNQRKLNHIQNLKTGLLQKMFPKDGEAFPDVRFPGFTSAWEQRKLGEVATEVKRKAEEDSNAPVMMISAGNGFIDQSEKYSSDNAGSSLKNYTLLQQGELAYNHGYSKLRNFGSCFDLKVKEARVPFVYHSFAMPNDDSAFFAYYLNSGMFDGELKKRVSSTARMDGLLNISYLEYMSLEVKRPNIDEQRKISEMFDTLDHLITLHQRKLKHLQEQKQALLQQMFV